MSKKLSMTLVLLVGSLAPVVPLAADESAAPFDPQRYQQAHVGEPTQIMVLGTPHLNRGPDDWDPVVLGPLLERLAGFGPDAIAIEALTGVSVQTLWQYRESYPGVATLNGGRIMSLAVISQMKLAMDMPQAEAEARRTLEQWPDSPTAAQRRRLAALFIAAGDPNSALVQWWQLTPAEQVADASISPLLVRELENYAKRNNENHLIAARLAAQLGLERVHPTDDQSVAPDPTMDEDLEAFMTQPWVEELRADPDFKALLDASNNLRTPAETLATYRLMNSAAAGQTDADGQWLSMLKRPSPGQVGRRRVAQWEVRNLRMVANVREVAVRHPGGRVLVIVGSAHKPWFDAYLRQMVDVQVVDTAKVLAE